MSKILVMYHSGTGNTEKLAKLVAEGASAGGAEVKLVKAGELDLAAAAAADGLAIGSPDYFSYVAGEVKAFFDKILRDERFQGKPYVGFGTHGGGAKVLGVLEKLAESCKLKKVAEGLLVKGAPAGEDVEKGKALGKALAGAVG
jgi:flavodoxin I